MNQPLKGGYYASPAKHTNGTTAHIPPQRPLLHRGIPHLPSLPPARDPHTVSAP